MIASTLLDLFPMICSRVKLVVIDFFTYVPFLL